MKGKCIINPEYEHLTEYIHSIPKRMETEGEKVYGGRNLIKKMTAPDGTPINVKRYRRPALVNDIIYSLNIRKPKGMRAFIFPSLLRQRGIESPQPIAYIEIRKKGLIDYSYFVSLHCPYENKLYQFGNAKEGEYEEMAEVLGRYIAKLHQREVLHRDLSPGNILWRKDENGEYHFSLVDTNRMEFKKIGIEEGCKNMARLWGPKRFFEIMAQSYADAQKWNQEDCTRKILKYRRAFWTRYRRKHQLKYNLEL